LAALCGGASCVTVRRIISFRNLTDI
jgi:hypothetical protein